ncbi:zf-HC2 domain-containing protein [Lysinibacter cavernae]|uniref:LPXTG-motif cell wall-anchored protein n=1 Tax=Lysinibacter cavernae TaxID=1640652 RepID=A0A7X5R1H9_9MICO|nr:sigma-70 family RNA polymerase sigma factor [Lysinibacter cavernae]NIH53861.1 LPXTG-motif cell wall-anchored protein [Lysinibacter cavernae]
MSESPELRNYLKKLGASWDEAEDIVAQTFEIYLTQSLAGKEPHTNPKSYLFTIAKRQLFKIWNDKSPTVSVEQDYVEVSTPFIDTATEKLEKTLVGAAFTMLQPIDQKIVWMLLVQQRSAQETADALGYQVNNTRTRFHRAKQTFRENYLKLYSESTSDPACKDTSELLSRYVLGSAPESHRRKLHAHLEQCERCTRVLSELTDEAASIQRIPIIIWAPVGASGLLATSMISGGTSAKAAAMSLLAQKLLIGGVGAALVTAGIVMIATSQGEQSTALEQPAPTASASAQATAEPTINPAPVPATEETRPQQRAAPYSVPEVPDKLLAVTPELTQLDTPLPGKTEAWSMSAQNVTSTYELPIFLEIRGVEQSDSDETLYLTLKSDSGEIVSNLPIAEALGHSVKVSTINPNESVSVSGELSRPLSDSDQSLSANMDFRFSSEATLPDIDDETNPPPQKHQPPSDRPGTNPPGADRDGGQGLTLTGQSVTSFVTIGLGLLLLGYALIRRRRDTGETKPL